MREQQRLVTVSEAAEILRVAPATLYQWCRERKVSHVRLGDRILLDAEEIIASARVPANGNFRNPKISANRAEGGD
jgi:excisionase family DNA binding protein